MIIITHFTVPFWVQLEGNFVLWYGGRNEGLENEIVINTSENFIGFSKLYNRRWLSNIESCATQVLTWFLSRDLNGYFFLSLILVNLF